MTHFIPNLGTRTTLHGLHGFTNRDVSAKVVVCVVLRVVSGVVLGVVVFSGVVDGVVDVSISVVFGNLPNTRIL